MALKGPVADIVVKAGLGTALTISVSTIAYFEGVRYKAYKDPVGILTVCYGETSGIDTNKIYTEAECRAQLEDRAAEIAHQVQILAPLPMPSSRLAALTSFAYNAGLDNFAHSTLLRKLNAGDVVGACNELPRWVYAQGVKLPGLVKRRAAERELCLKGVRSWT